MDIASIGQSTLSLLLTLLVVALPVSVVLRRYFGLTMIGLTGGIATGKSTVSSHLRQKHTEIIDFDAISRDVVACGTPAWSAIRQEFGDDILHEDWTLNREKLGGIVFNNKSKLKWLNGVMRGPIFKALLWDLAKMFFYERVNVIVLDCPLLFEAGFHRACPHNVVVSCSKEKQTERLMRRDEIDQKFALTKIDAQMPLEKKRKMASHVLDNDQDVEQLKHQVDLWWSDHIVPHVTPEPGWTNLARVVKPTLLSYTTAFLLVSAARLFWAMMYII